MVFPASEILRLSELIADLLRTSDSGARVEIDSAGGGGQIRFYTGRTGEQQPGIVSVDSDNGAVLIQGPQFVGLDVTQIFMMGSYMSIAAGTGAGSKLDLLGNLEILMAAYQPPNNGNRRIEHEDLGRSTLNTDASGTTTVPLVGHTAVANWYMVGQENGNSPYNAYVVAGSVTRFELPVRWKHNTDSSLPATGTSMTFSWWTRRFRNL